MVEKSQEQSEFFFHLNKLFLTVDQIKRDKISIGFRQLKYLF